MQIFYRHIFYFILSLKDETKKGQKVLKPSTSEDLSKEPTHHPQGEEDKVIPGHTPSLLYVTDRRREFRGNEGGRWDFLFLFFLLISQ